MFSVFIPFEKKQFEKFSLSIKKFSGVTKIIQKNYLLCLDSETNFFKFFSSKNNKRKVCNKLTQAPKISRLEGGSIKYKNFIIFLKVGSKSMQKKLKLKFANVKYQKPNSLFF